MTKLPRIGVYNEISGAFIYDYTPLRIFICNPNSFPKQALCCLARLLLFNESRFEQGRQLFKQVADPDCADFILCPCDLNYFEQREEQLYKQLIDLNDHEDRFLFFDHRDSPEVAFASRAVHCKVSLPVSSVSARTICIPYIPMVDDFFWYLHQPKEILYDLSFVGQIWKNRAVVIEVLTKKIERGYFGNQQNFHDGLFQYQPMTSMHTADEKCELRKKYITITRQSKFVLAIRGYGLNTFRFFEALSLGVPPILVSHECALPFSEYINYSEFCIKFEENDPYLIERICEIVYGTNPLQREAMGRLARFYYETYFSPRNFLFLFYDALSKAARISP